ncbi:MAG: FAD:protein FMN transferase [Mogibacterium sp.]|nr:FAD:protein FMN transferase [Mogibacterium sp.]
MNKRITSLLLLITMIIITQTSCAPAEPEPVSREEFLLDTICSISIYEMGSAGNSDVDADADAKESAEAAIDEAFALCRHLDDTLSRTKKDSFVGRINAAKGEWTEVSPETVELIQKGIEYSKLSDGAFDITVGGITELWDFHAAEGEAKLPNEKKLAEAVKHVGYANIEIEGNKVRLKDPETKIDLGGIAKGFIGDKMSELLKERGVTSGIINLGGNVICIGSKPDGENFNIGVEVPYSDRTEIAGKMGVKDKTLVTSGVYERKIEVDGKVYHHILDTKTGYPVDTDVNGVTLTAETGKSADIDALSTICLIKGSEEGTALIENMDGIEAVFILKDGSVKTTEGAAFEKDQSE